MFGLTQLEERAVWAVLVILVIVGFAWHERSLGVRRCEKADALASSQQDLTDARTHQKQQDAVITEGKTYAATTSAPPPAGAPVRLCDAPHPAPVPAATAPSPRVDAAPAVPAEAGRDSAQRPDVGPDLRANARDADAQIAGLQAYIREVCLAR